MSEILQECGTKLKSLDLADNKDLTGEGLSVLEGTFINLETLNLQGCSSITSQGLTDLLKICGIKLKSVNLVYNRGLTGEGLSVLPGRLINLETLDLQECSSLANQGLIDLLKICGTKLKSLYLADNKELTGEGVSVLEGKLINLETLNLGGCSSLTGQGFIDLLKICGTKLKSLYLADNKELTGEGLSVLEGKLINLETLSLRGCYSLANQGLIDLLKICGTKLKYLNLSGHHNLTGYGFSVLEGKLINLETLDLRGCPSLTGQGLTELLQICGTKLKYLKQ